MFYCGKPFRLLFGNEEHNVLAVQLTSSRMGPTAVEGVRHMASGQDTTV